VVAAVVHGLAGSGSKRATPVPAPAVERAAPPAGTLRSGLDKAAPAAPAFGTASRPARLQRFEASLRLRVRDDERLTEATREATRIARALGGYAQSVQYRTPEGRPGQASLELRIPAVRVQAALGRLADLGTLLSQRVSIEDLQRVLERQNAQIAQLRRAIAVYEQALRDTSLTPLERVRLRIQFREAKRALAQRTHARKSTVAEGSLARVSLVLATERPASAAVHRGRFERMLRGAASFLAVEAAVALYALIVVAPLALLIAGVWWAARALRRREERRLLSA
jgi:hypothetical protein